MVLQTCPLIAIQRGKLFFITQNQMLSFSFWSSNSRTCMASSLVGVITTAIGPSPSSNGGWSKTCLKRVGDKMKSHQYSPIFFFSHCTTQQSGSGKRRDQPEKRQKKAEGFPASGFRDSDDVTSGHDARNGLRLDRRRFFKVHFLDHLQFLVADTTLDPRLNG